MFTLDPAGSHMMPAHFGPRAMHPKASGWYRDVTAATVSYLTDRELLARHLPAPFAVGEEARITVVYACNRQVDWLAGHGYNMFAVSADAVFEGENDRLQGSYCLVMWENLTDPILTGRELQGIPKVYADIADHTVLAGELTASASHFGHPILELSVADLRDATDEEVAVGEAAAAAATPMSWRFLPSVGGWGTAVDEATAFPSENIFTSVQVGVGTVAWRQLTWEQNPTQFHIVNALHDLPILEYGPAIVSEGSTNLVVLDDLPRTIS